MEALLIALLVLLCLVAAIAPALVLPAAAGLVAVGAVGFARGRSQA